MNSFAHSHPKKKPKNKKLIILFYFILFFKKINLSASFQKSMGFQPSSSS